MFLLPGAQEVGRLWLNRTEWAGIGKGRSWKEGVGRGLSSCLEERGKSFKKKKAPGLHRYTESRTSNRSRRFR